MWSFKYLIVVYVFPHSLQEWWDQVCSAAGPLVSRWLTAFTNALQSSDKRTPRREVGERQRSCSCTEHLAGEMFMFQVQEMFPILCWFTVHCHTLLNTVWYSFLSPAFCSSSSDAVQSVTAGLLLVSQSVAHLTWSGQGESAQNWCNWIRRKSYCRFYSTCAHLSMLRIRPSFFLVKSVQWCLGGL